MRTKQLLLAFSLLFMMHAGHAQQTNKEKFKKLEWLIGKWTRTNPNAGQSGYETWTKLSDSKLSGKGGTMKGKKVVFTETLEFLIIGPDIFYTVIISGDKKLVRFKLTELSDTGFSCENLAHDFPKKIAYSRKGTNLKAVISGDGQSMDYIFVRDHTVR